jgi:hypothetical protein
MHCLCLDELVVGLEAIQGSLWHHHHGQSLEQGVMIHGLHHCQHDQGLEGELHPWVVLGLL